MELRAFLTTASSGAEIAPMMSPRTAGGRSVGVWDEANFVAKAETWVIDRWLTSFVSHPCSGRLFFDILLNPTSTIGKFLKI